MVNGRPRADLALRLVYITSLSAFLSAYRVPYPPAPPALGPIQRFWTLTAAPQKPVQPRWDPSGYVHSGGGHKGLYEALVWLMLM